MTMAEETSASGNCSDNKDIAAPPQGGVFVLTALRYAVMTNQLTRCTRQIRPDDRENTRLK